MNSLLVYSFIYFFRLSVIIRFINELTVYDALS